MARKHEKKQEKKAAFNWRAVAISVVLAFVVASIKRGDGTGDPAMVLRFFAGTFVLSLAVLLLGWGYFTKEKKAPKKEKSGGWTEIFKTLAWALVLAGIFRSLFFEPFHIPSKSMVPSLLVGDFVIVNKMSYGYSKYSFFGLPLFEGRKMYTEPKRGDVIVFKVPQNEFDHDIYIKRVVGLPGDKIQMKGGVLFINGVEQKQEPIADYTDEDTARDIPAATETMENGVKHTVISTADDWVYDNTEEVTVPADSFFMMGDNRDNSADSRADLGFVPKDNLIGRADIILFSSRGWLINPTAWRAGRFLKSI